MRIATQQLCMGQQRHLFGVWPIQRVVAKRGGPRLRPERSCDVVAMAMSKIAHEQTVLGSLANCHQQIFDAAYPWCVNTRHASPC